MILHIAKEKDWELAGKVGYYTVPSLEKDGFIHGSYPEQVVSVANANFKGQKDLVLLVIDSKKVNAEIRDENLEGGKDMYPHIYGRIELSAITETHQFHPDSNGLFVLPKFLSKPFKSLQSVKKLK